MKYHLYADNYKTWQPHEIQLKTDKFNADRSNENGLIRGASRK